MNPRKSLIVVSAVTVVTLLSLTFYGCGSSNNRATKSYGSNSDVAFLTVNTELHSFVDSTMKFIQGSFDAMSTVPAVDIYRPSDSLQVADSNIQVRYGPGQGDSVTGSYRYINGWHIITFNDVIAGSTVDFKDSIRFRDELNTPQQAPDALVSLLFKHRWSVSNIDTLVSHADLSGEVNYQVSDLNSTVATFTGKTSWKADQKLVTTDSTVWTSIDINATLSSLQIVRTGGGWLQSCPTNGSIMATVNLTRQKDSNTPTTSQWIITMSFNQGHTYVKLELGDVVWLDNWQACTPPVI